MNGIFSNESQICSFLVLKIDAIISRVASVCEVPMHQCQQLNFYQEGQNVLTGDILNGCNLQKVWNTLWEKADLRKKSNDINIFNSQNKWKKRGVRKSKAKFHLWLFVKNRYTN